MTPIIFSPINVIFGTFKQRLYPYEVLADLSFLINGAIDIDDCVQVADLTLARLKTELTFGVPSSAKAIRNDLALAENDLIEPGDVVEFIENQQYQSMAMQSQKLVAPKAKLVTPRYDDETRSLWFGSQLIKRLRKPAENQELVLRSFQELKWRKRIDDPLAHEKRQYTIVGLNRNHATPGVLRFGNDGTGKGIKWSLVND